jgi:hypothetical protein
MSKRLAGEDIEAIRTSQRGVYVGAWSTFIPGVNAVYARSVRVTRPSTIFVMHGDAFARFIQAEFPMAVHLLTGQMARSQRSRHIVGQREKLLALGTITPV